MLVNLPFWLLWAQAAWADGSLVGFVFDGAQHPLAGVVLRCEGSSAVTDPDGYFTMTLPSGVHALALTHQGQSHTIADVTVVDDLESELRVTWRDPLEVVMELPESPARAESPEVLVALTGVIRRAEDATPLSGARIVARGHAADASSDAQGRFSLMLPPGVHTVSVLAAGRATQTLADVEVGVDGGTLNLELVDAGLSLEDFLVRAPRIEGGTSAALEERRGASTVSEVIGVEQMSKSGDSSAAAALQRVTGLTVVGGKYVYVRGLGERYSATLLNGSTLPSPEPERRVVPLDLFPTGILESVVIQKTFSPDMPAEFGGGVVSLRSRGVPDDWLLDVSVTGGFNTSATWQEGLVAAGGPWDWTGFGTQHRALPTAVANASKDQLLAEGDMFSDRGYSAEELESFGEAVENRWALEETTIPIDRGASVTAGNRFDLPRDSQLGVLLGLSYSNTWDQDIFDHDYLVVGADGKLEQGSAYTFNEVANNIGLGGIGNVSLSIAEAHTFESTSVLIRSTEDSARLYQGFNRDLGDDIRVMRTRWIEQALLFQQFRGEHVFDAWQLDWRGALSWANRDEPDRREVRQDLENGTSDLWYLSDRPEGNSLFYSELADFNRDLGLDATVPLSDQSALKLGVARVDKERVVDTRRYKYMHKGPLSSTQDVLALDPEEIFVDEHIGPDGFQLEEVTRETDNYDANQRLHGAYGMVEMPLVGHLQLMAGARLERSVQVVNTFALFNPDAVPVVASLENTDLLPALTLTQGLGPGEEPAMQLRFGLGRTVSRPDFRELSPATFNDVTGGRQTMGNPDLERALIDNVDLRWEWYPTVGESLSVGVFAKQFRNPIETIVVVSAQHSVTYDNADGATNTGVEVDWRKGLGLVPGLEDLYVAGNVSLIRSRVVLGNEGIQTSSERPLQGQSPFVVNLQLGYDNPDAELSVAALYNVNGPRISEVGALGAPDTVTLSQHGVDLVCRWSFAERWKLSAKGQNLLDSPVATRMGAEVVESLRDGRTFSLGLGWGL